MRNNIYYKYRSLENFEHFVDILVNQRFFATTYTKMNDAMEGVYYHSGLEPKILKDIKNEKNKFKICSLSEDNLHPLLWAHYANGRRGVCIGAKIKDNNIDIQKVKYTGLPMIKRHIKDYITAKEILTYKEKSWEYESEVRVFTEYESKASFVKIQIEEIILGKRISKSHKELINELVKKLLPNVNISHQPIFF